MKNFINFLTKSTLAVLAIFGISAAANAQCAAGEVEVFIDVTTDQWGYELYWELVPSGDTCGSANAVFTGGNADVGCAGGGLRVASAAGAGAYGNNLTVTEGPFCLTIGQDYDIIAVDDWGDGGNSFSISTVAGSFATTAADDVFTFTANERPDNDLFLGSPTDVSGYSVTYSPVIDAKYRPLSQMTQTEVFAGVNVANTGLNDATNVSVVFNIDRADGGGVYTNVLTDTFAIGTLNSDSSALVGDVVLDESWYEEATFRFQYIVNQDSVDEAPSSDTITDFFTISGGLWTKVDLASDFGPFYDGNLFYPGPSAGGSALTEYEWGSLFYVPNGDSMALDSLVARYYALSTIGATDAPILCKISKIVDDGNGTFEILNDAQLVAFGSDTVSSLTASTLYTQSTTNFIDLNTGAEYIFEDNELYYISINQTGDATTPLNDGTVSNGVALLGDVVNYDAFVVSDSVYGRVFWDPIVIGYADGTRNGFTGWTSGSSPAMMIYLKDLRTQTPVGVMNEVEELEGVSIAPNPNTGIFNVSLDLDNAEVKFIITDISGRVANVSFGRNVNQEVKTFDISEYPAGVYFFTVVADGVRTTKRIVKQ